MIGSAIGVALLLAIGFWVFGGFALRLGGALLVVVGAVGLATAGEANGLLLIALGIAAWLTGHLHYALRRGAWKSVLARRAFEGIAATWRLTGRRGHHPSARVRARNNSTPGGR
jgi:hypothetical protein